MQAVSTSDVLLEKSLKLWENPFHDYSPQGAEGLTNFPALCGDIVEGYKEDRFSFHFHLFQIENRHSDSDICFLLSHGNESEVGDNPNRVRLGEQETPMLVNVAKFVQDEKRVARIPTTVRLHSLNLCASIFGNPVEAAPPKLAFESVFRFTYGELMILVGFLIRSRNQFPHKIVETRPEILQAIADQERDGRRNWTGIHAHRGDQICIEVYLSQSMAYFAFEAPLKLGFQALKVAVSPIDFGAHAIK